MKTDSLAIIEKLNLEYQGQIEKLTTENKSLIDSIQNITITESANSLDVLRNVQLFYDSAWLKLLYFVGVIGAFIIIAIGLFQWLFQYINKKENEELKKELKKSIDDVIKQKVDKRFETIESNLSAKAKEMQYISEASTFYLQARTLQNEGKFKKAVTSFFMSIRYLNLIKSPERIQVAMTRLLPAFQDMSEKDLNHLDKSIAPDKELDQVTSIKTLLDAVEKNLSLDSKVHDSIKDIRNAISKINGNEK